MKIPSMPFKILVLGAFSAEADEPWFEKPIRVDGMNPDKAVRSLGLSLHIPLDQAFYPAGGIDIGFECLKDFHPDALLRANPILKNILDARKFCEEAGKKRLSEENVDIFLNSPSSVFFLTISKNSFHHPTLFT